MRPNWILLGAILGATFVLHAAFGAHWLEGRVSAEQLEWWQTAAFHHGVHALAITGFGLLRLQREASELPGCLLLAGVLIFSTTLYVMALGGPRWLGAVTPIGARSWSWVGWASHGQRGGERGESVRAPACLLHIGLRAFPAAGGHSTGAVG